MKFNNTTLFTKNGFSEAQILYNLLYIILPNVFFLFLVFMRVIKMLDINCSYSYVGAL